MARPRAGNGSDLRRLPRADDVAPRGDAQHRRPPLITTLRSSPVGAQFGRLVDSSGRLARAGLWRPATGRPAVVMLAARRRASGLYDVSQPSGT